MESRLGDIIDDYCVKCRRIMNHSVVSILNGEPAKVRCRTCYGDHDYRREQIPPSKADLRKAALFQEVLATMPGQQEAEADPSVVEAEAAAPEDAAEEPKSKAKTKRAKK